MLSIQNEQEWTSFCLKVLKNKDLAKDSRFINNSLRVQYRDTLKKIICDPFADSTAIETVTQLDQQALPMQLSTTCKRFGTTHNCVLEVTGQRLIP
jgi:crotonobetainyl-CoA:carnitine CoA-transferase CaiB-like acyl-CoA transferase